jgi:hypothetical protein
MEAIGSCDGSTNKGGDKGTHLTTKSFNVSFDAHSPISAIPQNANLVQ